MDEIEVVKVLIWGALWGGIGSLTNGTTSVAKILYGILAGSGVVLLFYLLIDNKDDVIMPVEILIGAGIGLVAPYVIALIKSKSSDLLGGGN